MGIYVFIGLGVDNGMVWYGVNSLFIGTPSPPSSDEEGVLCPDEDAVDDGKASDVRCIAQPEGLHQFVPVLFDGLDADAKLIGKVFVLVSQGDKCSDLEHSLCHRCHVLFHQI